MTTYRTVMLGGLVKIQRKNWLGFWVYVDEDFDALIYFKNEKEAEDQIKEWQKQDKENGKVLKEYRDDS